MKTNLRFNNLNPNSNRNQLGPLKIYFYFSKKKQFQVKKRDLRGGHNPALEIDQINEF